MKTKMNYYKYVKTKNNIAEQTDVLINVFVIHCDIFQLIIGNRDALFILNFWSSLYQLFSIQQRLFTIFYLQTYF